MSRKKGERAQFLASYIRLSRLISSSPTFVASWDKNVTFSGCLLRSEKSNNFLDSIKKIGMSRYYPPLLPLVARPTSVAISIFQIVSRYSKTNKLYFLQMNPIKTFLSDFLSINIIKCEKITKRNVLHILANISRGFIYLFIRTMYCETISFWHVFADMFWIYNEIGRSALSKIEYLNAIDIIPSKIDILEVRITISIDSSALTMLILGDRIGEIFFRKSYAM